MKLLNVPIRAIRVLDRYRRDFGDLQELALSIGQELLQPIGITPQMELVFGERRLRACRDILRWDTIPAIIINVFGIIDGSFVENSFKKDLALSERVAIGEAVVRALGERRGGDHGNQYTGGKPQEVAVCRTLNSAFERAGFSNRETYRQAKAVVEAARKEPEKYDRLVQRMDKLGKVHGAYRELEIAREAERLQHTSRPLPEGPFHVAVIDPPWSYKGGSYALSRGGVSNYPLLSLEQIQGLPISSLMHPDSVAWLWTPNHHVARGDHCSVLSNWGFRPVSILTWDKGRPGTGRWLVGQTEHAVLAVRGKPIVRRGQPTVFHAPRRKPHSTKPEEFYRIVESICPGTRVELFARQPRPGWTSWGI